MSVTVLEIMFALNIVLTRHHLPDKTSSNRGFKYVSDTSCLSSSNGGLRLVYFTFLFGTCATDVKRLNVAITKNDRFKPLLRHSRNMHSSSFIIIHVRLNRQESFTSRERYLNWNQLQQLIALNRIIETFKADV